MKFGGNALYEKYSLQENHIIADEISENLLSRLHSLYLLLITKRLSTLIVIKQMPMEKR